MKAQLILLMAQSEGLAEQLKAVRQQATTDSPSDRGELMANLTLAQRAAENAADKLVRCLAEFP